MNRLANSDAAKALILLAFFAFFVHSLQLCPFHTEQDACVFSSAKSNRDDETRANSASSAPFASFVSSTTLSARRSAAESTDATFLSAFETSPERPCSDSCSLVFSPIKKNGGAKNWSTFELVSTSKPVAASPAPRDLVAFVGDAFVRAVVPVPLYLRYRSLLN